MDDLLIKNIEKYFPNVSRETIINFKIFLDHLLLWNKKINLVSKSCSLQELIERHLLDSLQLINHINSKSVLITDLGSGGGFPGMILAIAGYKCKLIEISEKKTIYLREAALKCNIKVEILNCDFKTLNGFKSNYIISRAVADISYLINNTKNIINSNTHCLFLKSAEQLNELDQLSKQWSFKLQIHKNLFSNGIILEISNLSVWEK